MCWAAFTAILNRTWPRRPQVGHPCQTLQVAKQHLGFCWHLPLSLIPFPNTTLRPFYKKGCFFVTQGICYIDIQNNKYKPKHNSLICHRALYFYIFICNMQKSIIYKGYLYYYFNLQRSQTHSQITNLNLVSSMSEISICLPHWGELYAELRKTRGT